MNSHERIMQLVAELRERIDQLEAEVSQAKESSRSGARSLSDDEGSPYDLAKVIPPTRTDEPDSIIGGQATRGFPDCVAVGNENRGYFCSGTLIAPNLVVSARHCADLPITRVFVGGYDVSRPDTGEVIPVRRENGQYLQFEHPTADLMVLVLETDSTIEPCHIAQDYEIDQSDTENAHLVGFGTVDFNGTRGFGVKRRVTVPITSLGCEDPSRFGCRGGTEMVAGHRGLSLDSCKGDSGGPLYIQNPDGGYFLLGATSRGISGPGLRTCGDGGIYVRVDQFIDWIREQTEIDIPGPVL